MALNTSVPAKSKRGSNRPLCCEAIWWQIPIFEEYPYSKCGRGFSFLKTQLVASLFQPGPLHWGFISPQVLLIRTGDCACLTSPTPLLLHFLFQCPHIKQKVDSKRIWTRLSLLCFLNRKSRASSMGQQCPHRALLLHLANFFPGHFPILHSPSNDTLRFKHPTPSWVLTTQGDPSAENNNKIINPDTMQCAQRRLV